MPNVTKIDADNFELYRFKVGVFFETQCYSANRADGNMTQHCCVTDSSTDRRLANQYRLYMIYSRNLSRDQFYISAANKKPVSELARTLLYFKRSNRPHQTAAVPIIRLFAIGGKVTPNMTNASSHRVLS